MLALSSVGVGVTVIAGWRAGNEDLFEEMVREAGGPEVHFVLEGGSTPFGPPPIADLAGLRFAPRACARAARLVGAARRAAPLVPADTARLHAHFANDAAALARYLAAATGLPYDVTAHAYDLYRDPFLLGPNLRDASRIFTVTEANLDWLRARAAGRRWDPSRMEVLRCGIDLAGYGLRDAPPAAPPFRVLCPARLVDKKGHDVLLAATARLVAEGLDVVVELAGEGPLRETIHGRAVGLGIAERVRFLGMISVSEVRDRMRAAHAVVIASRVSSDGDRDGLPVALVEAAALGVPLVATAISGIPELVTGETGWISVPGSPDALAGAMRDALTRADEARRRVVAARRLVEREFDVRAAADRLVNAP